FGVVTQAAQAFTIVLAAFSVIVTEFQRVSSFAAVASRLSSLQEASAAGAAPALAAAPSGDGQAIRHHFGGDVVEFLGLTLVTPRDGQVLIRDLSLQVPPNLRLLVTGPNGAGKSALFRAAAGVWWWGEGDVRVPPCGRV